LLAEPCSREWCYYGSFERNIDNPAYLYLPPIYAQAAVKSGIDATGERSSFLRIYDFRLYAAAFWEPDYQFRI
jgi:hypothetical protein